MDTTDTVVLDPDYGKVRAQAAEFANELQACLTADEIDLPSLPDVVLKIRDALARDDVDLNRLAELAGADPALAARLMKIANSALFSRSNLPPTNLHDAVVRLGSRMVRNTAIAIAAQQVFIGYSTGSIRTEIGRVWRHSVYVAALTHILLSLKRTEIPPEDGFLAGLLHEVGTLFILLRSKDREELWAQPDALQAIIRAWQARMGAKIVAQWEFSPALIEAVRDQDTRDLSCDLPIALADVVCIANYLADTSEQTDDLDAMVAALPDFGSFSLDHEALTFALETARTEVDMLLSNLESGGTGQLKVASSA
jgi:HD-like signal output (HDOD) protein